MASGGHGSAGFVGEAIGAFVADSPWPAIGPELRHEAKRSLLNFFGGALAVGRDPEMEVALRVLRAFAGPGTASLIGREGKLDALSASFVNAVASNLLDYDDTHLNTVIHPTAPVAPPLLALAEERGIPGAEVLHAFILGAEVECRIGNAVSPGHYARGWHITATCGVFGAAVAAGRLLGLSARQIWNALGIAASEAAGIVENLPSAAKNVGVGNAARNGLFAALLAAEGYGAAPAAIEGRLGWARAAGDEPKLDEILSGLGTRWELLRNTYKPYPCGIVLHSVIDACLDLRAAGLKPEDIASVVVRGHPLLLQRGDRAVANERDSRVSIHHSVAVSFLRGASGLREYTAEAVADPAVAAFRGKVRAVVDPELPVGAASVTVRTTAGETRDATVMHARGSEQRPLSDRDIEAKLIENAAVGGFAGDTGRVIEAVWRIEDAERDVATLMRLASAG